MNWIWLDTVQDHQRWGVSVKSSQLLNHRELGLYATKNFHIDDHIAPYLGELLSIEQRHQRYGNKWGPYVYFKPWGHPCIDAIFYRGAAAFANDGTWIPMDNTNGVVRRPVDLSNVYLKKGWLHAKCEITAGAELLLDYGHSYWKHRILIEECQNLPRFDPPRLVSVEDIETVNVILPSPTSHHHHTVPQLNLIETRTPQNHISIEINQLTPVEMHEGYWFKRDDQFKIFNVCGGKARACLAYVTAHHTSTLVGVISGGARHSPQVQIVGHLAHGLGLKARLHLPQGKISEEIRKATLALGHEVFQWFPGFNHVINARAKADVQEHPNWLLIPFGMECEQAIQCTAHQVKNLPFDDPRFQRIVVPVGSGMTLIGIYLGLVEINKIRPILGVIVGQDPMSRIQHWLTSSDWKSTITLVHAVQPYHQTARQTQFADLSLDPIYEAKVIPFIQPGDLIWLIGHH